MASAMVAQVMPFSLTVHGDTDSQDSVDACSLSKAACFATISKHQTTSETCSQDDAQPTLSDRSTAPSDDEAVSLATTESSQDKNYSEFFSEELVKKRLNVDSKLWIEEDDNWADHADDPVVDDNVHAEALEGFPRLTPGSPEEKGVQEMVEEESSTAEGVDDMHNPDPQPEHHEAGQQQPEQPERRQTTREEDVVNMMTTHLLEWLKVKAPLVSPTEQDIHADQMVALLTATKDRLEAVPSRDAMGLWSIPSARDEIVQSLHTSGPYGHCSVQVKDEGPKCGLRGNPDVASLTWRRLRAAAERLIDGGQQHVGAVLDELVAPAGGAHRYQCLCGAELAEPVPAGTTHLCRSAGNYAEYVRKGRAHSGPCQGKQKSCGGEVQKMYKGKFYCNNCFRKDHRNCKPEKQMVAKPPCCKGPVESVRHCPECSATFCAECCLRSGPVCRIEPQGAWPVKHEFHAFLDAFERRFNTPITKLFRLQQNENAFAETEQPLFKVGKECIHIVLTRNGQDALSLKIKAPIQPRKTIVSRNELSTPVQAAEGVRAGPRGVKVQICPGGYSRLKHHVQRRNLHTTDSGALLCALALQEQALGPYASVVAYARPDKANKSVAQQGDYKNTVQMYFTVFIEFKQDSEDAEAAQAQFCKMQTLDVCWLEEVDGVPCEPRTEQFAIRVQRSDKSLSENDKDPSCQWLAQTADERRRHFADEAALGWRTLPFDNLFTVRDTIPGMGRKKQRQGGGARAAAPGYTGAVAHAWQPPSYLPAQPQPHPQVPLHQRYQSAAYNECGMHAVGYEAQDQCWGAYCSPSQTVHPTFHNNFILQ